MHNYHIIHSFMECMGLPDAGWMLDFWSAAQATRCRRCLFVMELYASLSHAVERPRCLILP
jgi:hypothetical protein